MTFPGTEVRLVGCSSQFLSQLMQIQNEYKTLPNLSKCLSLVISSCFR